MRSRAWCWAARCAARSATARCGPSTPMVGVALQLVAVLVAAWLLATPLTSSDQPNLAAAVRGSQVLAEVDDVAPRVAARRCRSGCRRCWTPRACPTCCSRSVARRSSTSTRPTPRWPTIRWSPTPGPACVKIRGVAPELPESARGQRIRRRAEPGDVQRARGRRVRDASPSRPTARPTTPAWCPTTRTPTSRSSTCRTCRRRRWSSRRPRPRRPGPTRIVMGYPGGGDFTATPARIREIIELNGPDIYRDHDRHPRGLHHQRHCATGQFGWTADRPRRPGARRGVRCRGRRRRHRLRADRQRGRAADATRSATPRRCATGTCITLTEGRTPGRGTATAAR